MKRIKRALFMGLALCLAGAGLSMAQYSAAAAGYVKRGNWTSARQNAYRQKTPRSGHFSFQGIFGPDAPAAQRGSAARTITPWFERFLLPRSAPTIIAPDVPVVEYVEKPKIYVYPEPKLLPLKDTRLKAETASEQAAAILQALREGKARVRLEKGERNALIAFYKSRNFEPIWLSGADISPRGQLLLAYLARAHEHGLKDEHYRVPVVWENAGDATALSGNTANLARLDVELTAMALRLARHLSGGVVNPNLLSSYHDLHPPKVAPAAALKSLAEAEDPTRWLESLAPSHFAYGLMKRELARLRESGEEKLLPPIPVGKLIRPGMKDERLKLIRRHLQKLGLLQTPAETVTAEPAAMDFEAEADVTFKTASLPAAPVADAVYDKDLEQAIRKFQKMAGLKPDGLIGRGTIGALNRRNSVSTKKARIEKLVLNMERMRWMPRHFGETHFLVNVPAFEVYLYEGGRIRWKSRVITGKPKNQTAFFSDKIEYVVFNPYWGVPQSIIRKEFIPKLMRDPSWLDREGYEVRDKSGRVISSTAVNWAAYFNAKVIPFDIRQLPGDKNALGRIKVLFPNKHSIYMHDTPFKGLFNRRRRAFSHGCVRVQKPRELAELVSGLDPFEIENYLKDGRNKQIKLDHSIPVHIAYFTVWPDASGKLRYYDDVYGRDKLLRTALNKHDAAYRGVILQAGLR